MTPPGFFFTRTPEKSLVVLRSGSKWRKMVIGLKTMYSMMWRKGDHYRAEVGRAGDGARPLKARDTGRGMRSRVEVYRRPPEGSEGCVCGISPQAEGVRTQSRRHLNVVKVETGRGKGAKRLAGPKLRIDRGGMGGGGVIDFKETTDWEDDVEGYWDDDTTFNQNRKKIFHYCLMAYKKKGDTGKRGTGSTKYPYFALWNSKIDDSTEMAHVFLHELGHNLLGRNYDETSVLNAGKDINELPDNALASHLTAGKKHEYDDGAYWRWAHCPHSNCLMQSGSSGLDFCDDCWNAMYLRGCFRFEEDPTTHYRSEAWWGEEGVDY